MLLPLENLRDALAVLAALITPAVLILAAASLASSTSSRLASITARTRDVVEAYRQLNDARETGLHADERESLLDDLDRAAHRSRLLQRALYAQYLSVMIFALTSAGLGLSAVWFRHLAWIWVFSALVGAAFLLYSALLLVLDSRLGIRAVETEMLNVLTEAGLPTGPTLGGRLRSVRGAWEDAVKEMRDHGEGDRKRSKGS